MSGSLDSLAGSTRRWPFDGSRPPAFTSSTVRSGGPGFPCRSGRAPVIVGHGSPPACTPLSLTAGRIADIVILEANPLVDIPNTRRIHAVVQSGRVFTRRDLDAMLTGVRSTVAREASATNPPSPSP